MITKIAITTGANRGLGRNMAVHLARRGVGIVGTFRGDSEDGSASTAAEIEAAGGRAAMLQLDVSRAADFRAFAEQLQKTL